MTSSASPPPLHRAQPDGSSGFEERQNRFDLRPVDRKIDAMGVSSVEEKRLLDVELSVSTERHQVPEGKRAAGG